MALIEASAMDFSASASRRDLSASKAASSKATSPLALLLSSLKYLWNCEFLPIEIEDAEEDLRITLRNVDLVDSGWDNCRRLESIADNSAR